jgi:hypothetical protein
VNIYGWVKSNDGLSWCVNGNANIEKQKVVNLGGLFKVLLQWIW